MQKTTKAGIGALLAGLGALVAFVSNWIVTKQTPSAEAFEIVGAAVGTAVAAGFGLIKAADNK